ncbi:MAG TPA: hypothetical protein VMH04_22825 [Candidatus Solibacter sp.]|nr:hypothetical protein [Candidatus Solibacter sp.]
MRSNGMGVSTAEVDVLNSVEAPDASSAGELRAEVISPQRTSAWNADSYARAQIRGLVRQVFLAGAPRSVRQVVFSPIEADTGVRTICRRVGEALARETASSIAVLSANSRLLVNSDQCTEPSSRENLRPLQRIATRVRDNLWLVPRSGLDFGLGSASSLLSFLAELRREFEYSIVEAPPAGERIEAATMAQFADGIILVLAAHRTRRVTARKVKEMLEASHVRVLGTILSERTFPVPEGLYRRL